MVFDELPKELDERLEQFDEVVSWYGANRSEFRAAMPTRTTFLDALPPMGSKLHATDFFAQQVGAPLGLIPFIDVSPTEWRGSVVIHPFSGGYEKNWPFESFQKLAAKMPVAVEWAHDRFEDLSHLAQWMKGAALYLGNDSGISHLAAAIGMPTIVLFRASDPKIWAPRGDHVLAILM